MELIRKSTAPDTDRLFPVRSSFSVYHADSTGQITECLSCSMKFLLHADQFIRTAAQPDFLSMFKAGSPL